MEKPVPVPAREKQERPAGVVENGAAEETVHMADVPAPPSEKPRSVEEMLREADLSDPAADSVPVAAAVAGGEDSASGASLPAEDPDEVMPPMKMCIRDRRGSASGRAARAVTVPDAVTSPARSGNRVLWKVMTFQLTPL